MIYLLDTCTFLWACLDERSLSSRAREILSDPEIELFVSVISEWEIYIKTSIGKLVLPSAATAFLRRAKEELRLASLPLVAEDCARFSMLAAIAKDPFDKMLASQSIEQEIPILSPDIAIARYGAKTVW